MPKAGGTSFKNLLSKHFGAALKLDYNDQPINTPIEERHRAAEKNNKRTSSPIWKIQNRNVHCIHGHFLPYKYSNLFGKKNVQFVTWMRDPVERILSHYYFWKENSTENMGALHQRMINENWSLEEFICAPELQNVYTQFLWKFPLENFDFIGITENIKEDYPYFASKYLKQKVEQVPHVNPTSGKKDSSEVSNEVLEKIRALNAADYKLYEHALALRKERN
jgi:hypothetical protein